MPARHETSSDLDRASEVDYKTRATPFFMEDAVDLDDLMPAKKPSGVMIGENLSTLSVAELEKRIKDLESEIERVRIELDKKRKHEAAARSLFKS